MKQWYLLGYTSIIILIAVVFASCERKPKDALSGFLSTYRAVEVNPELVLKIEETDDVFFEFLGSIAGDSGENVYLTDRGRNQFYHFSIDGSLLGVYGSEGEGPGEFRYMSNIFVARDTFYIYDFNLARLTSYAPNTNGNLSRVRTLEIDVQDGLTPRGVFKSQQYYIVEGFEALPDGDQTGFLALLNRDGSMHNPFFMGLQVPEYGIIDMGDFSSRFVRPFARRSHYRVSSDDFFYYGWNDSVRVHKIDLSGNTVATIRSDVYYRPVLESDVDLSRYPDIMRSQVRNSIPETRAAYDGFHVDGNGNILLNLGNLEGNAEHQWIVLSEKSELIASFKLPDDIIIFMVGGDLLYGVNRAETGHFGVVYRLDY